MGKVTLRIFLLPLLLAMMQAAAQGATFRF